MATYFSWSAYWYGGTAAAYGYISLKNSTGTTILSNHKFINQNGGHPWSYDSFEIINSIGTNTFYIYKNGVQISTFSLPAGFGDISTIIIKPDDYFHDASQWYLDDFSNTGLCNIGVAEDYQLGSSVDFSWNKVYDPTTTFWINLYDPDGRSTS